MTTPRHYLGIDGGATKAEAAIINTSGQILAKTQRRGFMLMSRIQPDQAECLGQLTAEVCKQAGLNREDLTTVVAGMSGVDFPDEHDRQWTDIAGAISLPREKILLVNDGVVALWGATCRSQAVLLHHGTDMITVYRSDLGAEKLFDNLNVGLKFDLRIGLRQMVARMIDGRERATLLKDTILNFLGLEEARFVEAVYKAQHLDDETLISKEKLTKAVPIAISLWEAGDPAAAELISATFDEYLVTIKAMLSRLGTHQADIIYGGGLIKHTSERFKQTLLKRTEEQFPGASPKFAELPPSVGAALMAAYKVGEAIEPLFQDTLRQYR